MKQKDKSGSVYYTDAHKRAIKRYYEEKTDNIQVRLPKGYGKKVADLATKLNISKAQTIKNAVDMYFSSVFGDMDN